MPVGSIGSISDSSNSAALRRAGMDQEDFIRLFLAQLSFQDPLEPMNNQEFLVQLAQFTNLDQTRQMNERLESLLTFQGASQSIGLLGKKVEIVLHNGSGVTGEVTTVTFEQGFPLLAVKLDNGQALSNVSLSQIRLVRN
ncbi:MAG TPA: flagellar hook capping FlgD N-terminal domain-containing protein [Gammaproteobacteria bacterium]|nr:flagellar hook capping FlgD N-terminal domain-containing protein [Gammaproteobacteria bacterium]